MSLFACASCGAAVPAGRLACPACGELLASVAGRTGTPRVSPAPPAEEEPVLAPDAEPAPGPAASPEQPDSEEPLLEPEPELVPAPRPATSPGWPYPRPPLSPVAAAPQPAAVPIPPTGAYGPGASFAGAGSLPPIGPDAPVSAAPVWPAAPPPTAPRWGESQAAAAARWASVAGAGAGGSGGPAASVPQAAEPARSEGGLAGLPALPLALAERLVAIATGIVAVTFLLPWAPLMIGAVVVGDPWQQLGILGSWHWLAWLASLPVLLLAMAGGGFPVWLRLGVVPIAYGGFVIGLTWPYVLGPIGGAPAPLVAVVASAALIVLGAMAVRPGGISAPDTGG